MEMPFGKHKGEDLEDIPLSYLRWVLRNVYLWDDELRSDMENLTGEEVTAEPDPDRQRGGGRWNKTASGGQTTVPPPPAPPSNLDQIRRDLIDAVNLWRRSMAAKHHPDRNGGDGTMMTAMNDAADKLMKEIDGSFTRHV